MSLGVEGLGGVWRGAGHRAGGAMGVRLSFLPRPRGDSASF